MSDSSNPLPTILDSTGGTVKTAIKNVFAFSGANGDMVGPEAGRMAVSRIVTNCAEIVAKVAPDVSVSAFSVGGEMRPNVEVVGIEDFGMDLEEANQLRLAVNGYMETTSYLVQAWAAAHGLTVPYQVNATGAFMLAEKNLVSATVPQESAGRPGLGATEFDSAVKRWSNNLATMAALVNSLAPVAQPVTEPTDATQPFHVLYVPTSGIPDANPPSDTPSNEETAAEPVPAVAEVGPQVED